MAREEEGLAGIAPPQIQQRHGLGFAFMSGTGKSFGESLPATDRLGLRSEEEEEEEEGPSHTIGHT